MHIPPYFLKSSWQRFLFGCFIGAVCAYTILMFMYGSMYEQKYEENVQLQSEVAELKKQNEALLADKKDLNKKTDETSAVESIEVKIRNKEELMLDRLIVHQLEDMIKQELDYIIGTDISSLADSDHLLLAAIENKIFTIDEFNYSFKISLLTISRQVKITADAKISKE